MSSNSETSEGSIQNPISNDNEITVIPNDKNMDKSRKRTRSDSSIEIYIENDSDTEIEERKDSGICDQSSIDGKSMLVLEQKIDRLSDMFLEQCRLLTTLKQEIRDSKSILKETEMTQQNVLVDLLKHNTEGRMKDDGDTTCQAKILLNAIENRRNNSIDSSIKEAVTSFLQSEELKQKMLHATADSMKEVVDGCASQDMTSLYLVILEQSQQRLFKHVTRIVAESFTELERNSVVLFESVKKISNNFHLALERHQNILKAATESDKNAINGFQYVVEELLHSELKQWRQKVLDVFTVCLNEESKLETPSSLSTPIISQPQPPNTELSLLDQMMTAAEITNLIDKGELNSAFEKALLASDLKLVMTACRVADFMKMFDPRALTQPVLLSLIQQLATDMVHDTQIKCRYMEEAIISLNTAFPGTRTHLPLVVGEIRKHLTNFLQTYSRHEARRRITLILMAAENLLK